MTGSRRRRDPFNNRREAAKWVTAFAGNPIFLLIVIAESAATTQSRMNVLKGSPP
jgi:hypothetical protein